METFDKEPQKHLYKLWNQMSSGSYMPPAVKLVEIDGSSSILVKSGEFC
jgi:RNA-directed DNA polymerase